jgi:hypothetical protein
MPLPPSALERWCAAPLAAMAAVVAAAGCETREPTLDLVLLCSEAGQDC